jgi:hypothetical protein
MTGDIKSEWWARSFRHRATSSGISTKLQDGLPDIAQVCRLWERIKICNNKRQFRAAAKVLSLLQLAGTIAFRAKRRCCWQYTLTRAFKDRKILIQIKQP